MNRVPQKSAKWGTRWIRKKECDNLLSPNAKSAFGLLQSVLAPILPTQTDAPLATLTNAIHQMADITADLGPPIITLTQNYIIETYNIF